MRLKYVGDPERVYPQFGIEPKSGEVHDLPFDPEDGRWTPIEETKKRVKAADTEPTSADEEKG
ncbi:hypothetical protein ACFVUS_12525 [Nocardia sp. NPDC058058]|uniref:hypothetical protein n=1 Tax=Nocardia sp. NPDC058058 TaxID=3346317 RepID=UPI0036D87BFA